jgi:hypothetical protein
MRQNIIASLALAVSLAAATSAKADVVYAYTGLPTYQGQNGEAAVGTTLTLDLTDAAVASGSFTLSGYGSLDSAAYTGDVSGLVSFTTPAPFNATQTSIDGGGSFTVSFTFDATGAITTDTVEYYGLDSDGQLSGTGILTTGSIGSDALGCDSDASSGICTVSGAWTATSTDATTASVPEPTTWALLGSFGLLLIAVRRRWAISSKR